MSKETLEYHWGKHHRAYVDNLKKQIEGTELASQSLENIIKATYNNGEPTAAFNNAAQVYAHMFTVYLFQGISTCHNPTGSDP
jgi:Fe-Mn family superoxide dismutase